MKHQQAARTIRNVPQVVTQHLAELQRLVDEIKADIGQPTSPDKSKPLYQFAYEALEAAGRPVRAPELVPALRRLTHRRSINAVLTYQALEYGKRYKGNIVRRNGKWMVAPKSH